MNASRLASRLASSLATSAPTIGRYVDLLCDLLLVRRLQPLIANVGKRLIKAPKTYIRDSGLLHALLGIADYDALCGHPILGFSWEGFVIENLIAAAPKRTQSSFYRTAAGADLDLVLDLPTGERWAIEIKRGAAPRGTKGFHIACADIKSNRRFPVYPEQERYPTSATLEAISSHERAAPDAMAPRAVLDAASPEPDAGVADAGPVGAQNTRLEVETAFWNVFAIDANWVEYFPTLDELAQGSDLALVVHLSAVRAEAIVQGDAPEDIVAQAVLTAEVSEELLGREVGSSVEFSMVLSNVGSRASIDEQVLIAQEALPSGEVVLFLRRRTDTGKFRLVNGYGLWAETRRAQLDVPIEYHPLTPEGPYAAELMAIHNLDELVSTLRNP